MKKIILLILVLNLLILNGLAQTFTEKEIFKSTYKGKLEANNFIYDKSSGTFCYLYAIEDENKYFIISNNSISEKYDYFNYHETCFDSKGNYYTVSTDFEKDYGLDNYFLIVNGKNVLNFNYIDGYSAYLNRKNEFVFIYRQFDEFKLGYYSLENGFRSSEGYKTIEPLYKITRDEYEEEPPILYLTNKDGERGYLAMDGEKCTFLFGNKKIPTIYSDINKWSVTLDKYDQLSFIAEKNGKIHDSEGKNIVVVGNNEFKEDSELRYIFPPILFNSNNQPIYVAADSIGEFIYENHLFIGNEKQKVFLDNKHKEPAPVFSGSIYNIEIENDGSIKYLASEIVSEDGKINSEQNNTITYSVKNNVAKRLGYNVGKVRLNTAGGILFSAIDDIAYNKYSLNLIYDNKREKISEREFDDIVEYGFLSSREIYYIGLNHMVHRLNDSSGYLVYIGDKYLGNYVNILLQSKEYSYDFIKFSSDGRYAFAVNEILDTVNLELAAYVFTNEGRLPFTSKIESDKKGYSNISNLIFTKENILFYTGSIDLGETIIEILIDNKPFGKIYNSISDVEYNESENKITFCGVRDDKIYYVAIQF